MTTATAFDHPRYPTPHAYSTSELTRDSLTFVGRWALVALFLASGLSKIGTYDATTAYMASVGVPGALLPAVIALEVFGALAVGLGWRTRLAALMLAGFTVLSALLFHRDFSDPVQVAMFLKNISIAGAFALLVANGAGTWSVDAYTDRTGRTI